MVRVIDADAIDDWDNFGPGPASRAATRAEMHKAMGGAKAHDSEVQAAYEEGRKEVKRTTRPAPSQRRRQSTGAAIRQIQAPVRSQITSASRTLGLVLLIVLLYDFLESAELANGVLGGLTKAIAWLKNPEASIPYKEG